jgi:hypothetical protein
VTAKNLTFDSGKNARLGVSTKNLVLTGGTYSQAVTARRSIFEYAELAIASLRDQFEEERYSLYAMDDAGVETYLGDTTAGALTGVSLADGTYRIEARPAGAYWRDVRTMVFASLTIAYGEIDPPDLPPVESLRADPLTGWGRDIYFTYSADLSTALPVDFAVWYGSSSPVSVSGTPDDVITALGAQANHKIHRAQTAAEWVAVRARSGTDTGPVAEIELDYPAEALTSPAWQWGER